MELPKISVVVAVYNSEKYLERCLDSILNQTIKDIEVICVNDGSTDNSWDILKRYSSKDTRVKIYTQENKGAGAAKDFGLYQATGDYVAFCDSDDEMPLHSLSIRYEKAIKENADIVVGNYEEVYDNGKRIVSNIKNEKDIPFWWIFNSIVLFNKLFSRKFIVNNNLHIPKMHQSEDRVFMTDVFLCNPKIVTLDDVLYYWIRHEKAKQCTLSHRFLEQDYFDRIGSWFYSINNLLNNNIKEANYLLIKRANYLKGLFNDFPDNSNKKNAFEAIQQLMCRADWSNDYELFRKIWGLSYEEFATLTYETYMEKMNKKISDNKYSTKNEECLQPKVSVIVPCYNSSRYLRECMDSIINQTLKEIEIICVDDGSTDDTLEILNEYAKIDRRIRVLHQENKYAGAARNLGMSIARGEYLIFLDSDDFFDLNMLKLTYMKAKEDSADVLVFNAYHYNTETKDLINAPWMLNTSYLPNYRPFSRKDIPKHIFSFVSTPPWNKLFRREYIENIKLQFQTTKRMNDIYFVMVAIALADKITILDQKLIFYRVNIPSSLQGTISESPTDVLDALTAVRNALISHGIYEEIEQSFVNLCIRNLVFALDSIKTGKAFEELYNLIRNCYLEELKISGKPRDYFYRDYYYWRYREIEDKSVAEYLFDRMIKEKSKQPIVKTVETVKTVKVPVEKPILHYRSYKLGCAITWLPRKIRGGIRCLKEHGIVHTWRRTLQHLGFNIELDKKHDFGLNKKPRKPRVIVSLTSFPERIPYVHKTIETILNQSVKPDMVILWLAREQFKKKEKELPKDLLKLRRYGLTIRWCEDLKSYKKLIPALKKYPNDIIVTADDDVYYDKDWLKYLYESYLKEPYYIHAHRITKFYIEGGEYKTIPACQSVYCQPSYLHKPVGIGGVLYPPHCLYRDVTNKKLFMNLAPTNDDIWFWLMGVINKTKVLVVKNNIPVPKDIEETKKGPRLSEIKDKGQNLFWKDFRRILEHYPQLDSVLRKEYEHMCDIERANKVKSELKNYDYYKSLKPTEYRAELILWYYNKTNKFLNLDNPRTYNEKIQWMKLYDTTPIKTRLADKYLVREWVAERIGEEFLVPIYGVWNNFNDITFEKLPKQFVLKANHGCGWNLIVTDKDQLNYSDAKKKFDTWLNTNFAFKYGLELQYRDIEPKIIAEKYLENSNGDLYDYKFWCFNGKVEYIMVITERRKGPKMAFFNRNWDRLNMSYNFEINQNKIPKPQNLKKMIKLAEKLGEGFPHVRVDFYCPSDGKIYFGEMTFTSASGVCKWNLPEWDIKLGSLIMLPEKQ